MVVQNNSRENLKAIEPKLFEGSRRKTPLKRFCELEGVCWGLNFKRRGDFSFSDGITEATLN
jgi:hypothetical protein